MDSNEADSAFLDIAANLLAVILIVTMFSLLATPPRPHSASEPDAMPDPSLPFQTPRRELFPPFSRFYFVLEGRVIRWDEDAVLTALLADATQSAGTVAQGSYRWKPERLPLRDIDAYTLTFQPDPAALQTQETPLTAARAAELATQFAQDYAQTRTAPVFIVYPSGMEAFAQLYPLLEQARLRLRWFAFAEGKPLDIGRFPQQFTDYGIYW